MNEKCCNKEGACDIKCPCTGLNISGIARCKIALLEKGVAPLVDLAARFWLAWAFWKSGMIKFNSPETNVMLFEYEYALPSFMPVELSATLATYGELLAAVLLAVGLMGRFGAFLVLGMTAFIQFYAYSGFAAHIADMGYWSALFNSFVNPTTESQIHYMWMLLALFIMVRGPGKISLDSFCRKKFVGGQHLRQSA